ncbi:MAG: sensor histidine kinase [Mycobacteriales bacterium]
MGGGDLRTVALFDGLDDGQLAELAAAGDEVHFAAGQELFVEGRPAEHWWVLLAGTVSLVRRLGNEEAVLAVMESPGQWAGGFRAWDPNGVYLATGRATRPGRMLRVPAPALRDRADAWFPLGVHLLQGLVGTVRRIESVARQRESLVALGTLAAGFAHEINNPAAAATRAAGALAETGEALLSSLGRLAQASISAPQLAALDLLRREITPPTASPAPLAVADLEDDLSDWLAAHGVQRDWLIAPPFAAAGVDAGWCERAAELVGPGPLEPALEWVAGSLSMAALLAEVTESTRRVSDLIAVVRSYSQLDRASLQWTDVTEGLESTLVMLAHRRPAGVAVVRDYGAGVPRIEAFAGELNQVWTHLIDNALDAMGDTGTLRLSTRATAGGLVVEVADTGPGMSEAVRAHAFEPFYTTKDVGQGTGLGLDVSRRIVVERHGGDIAIESSPGWTVLRVRLPLRAKAMR